MHFKWPQMEDNFTREDLDVLINFLQGMPRLTQSAQRIVELCDVLNSVQG